MVGSGEEKGLSHPLLDPQLGIELELRALKSLASSRSSIAS